MSILTDYMEKKLLDHIFGQAAAFTRPSALYLGLSTTAFADSDTGSTASAKEPSQSSYSRVRIDNISTYDTGGHYIRNNSSIDFAEATGSWGSIGYWGIFDVASGAGNMLMHGSFSSATTVASGDQFRISSGDLQINFPSSIYAGNDASYTVGNTTYYGKAKWRKQIAYLLGFEIYSGASFTANEKFLFYNNTASGFEQDRLYLAVKNSAFPTSGLTGSEISQSGTGYARVKILEANNSTIDYFNAATTSSGTTSISNNVVIQFPEAASSWGNISHFAIFRGSSSTDQEADTFVSGRPTSQYPLISGALTSTKTVNSGDRLRFGIGDLVITAS
jgi:hypothetical protein